MSGALVNLNPCLYSHAISFSALQVNYLGHFLLILHLLPVLRETGVDCRIISVSSIAHERGKFDLDNIQAQRSYNRFIFYGNSKLFQVVMTWKRFLHHWLFLRGGDLPITGRFHSQRTSNTEFWCFLCCQSELTQNTAWALSHPLLHPRAGWLTPLDQGVVSPTFR